MTVVAAFLGAISVGFFVGIGACDVVTPKKHLDELIEDVDYSPNSALKKQNSDFQWFIENPVALSRMR